MLPIPRVKAVHAHSSMARNVHAFCSVLVVYSTLSFQHRDIGIEQIVMWSSREPVMRGSRIQLT